MGEPHASRPYMPGYGLLGPDEGTGLLPWSWAEERLFQILVRGAAAGDGAARPTSEWEAG